MEGGLGEVASAPHAVTNLGGSRQMAGGWRPPPVGRREASSLLRACSRAFSTIPSRRKGLLVGTRSQAITCLSEDGCPGRRDAICLSPRAGFLGFRVQNRSLPCRSAPSCEHSTPTTRYWVASCPPEPEGSVPPALWHTFPGAGHPQVSTCKDPGYLLQNGSRDTVHPRGLSKVLQQQNGIGLQFCDTDPRPVGSIPLPAVQSGSLGSRGRCPGCQRSGGRWHQDHLPR